MLVGRQVMRPTKHHAMRQPQQLTLMMASLIISALGRQQIARNIRRQTREVGNQRIVAMQMGKALH
jgi:hypothetical protein